MSLLISSCYLKSYNITHLCIISQVIKAINQSGRVLSFCGECCLLCSKSYELSNSLLGLISISKREG